MEYIDAIICVKAFRRYRVKKDFLALIPYR